MALSQSGSLMAGADPAEAAVDMSDVVAVLNAQLDYYEKYRGGIVLGAYRCACFPTLQLVCEHILHACFVDRLPQGPCDERA
jgi:hypothetical protein